MAKINNSASTLVVRVAELESSLEIEKKQHQEAFGVVAKMNYLTEEDKKTLQQDFETHVEALKALEGEVVGLWKKFHDSPQ